MTLIVSLRSEIQNDPAALGYAALVTANNDQGIADLLNDTLESNVGWAKRNDFLSWSASSIRSVIEDTAANQADPLRASALVLQSICNGGAEGIDFSRTENITLLDAWVAAGKISATEKDALLAFATSNIPRSEKLFGQLITANHVAQAVRDDLGNSLIT